MNEKDRTEHTHHYEDAAVLTLIPPASIRDNILKEYNEAVDNNALNQYKNPKPRNWESFHQSMITSLKDEIIINHTTENRTLQQTKKYQRSRGKFVPVKNNKQIVYETDTNRNFVYHTDTNGNIIYKRNEKGQFLFENGNKIPIKKMKRKVQTGFATRGKLHDESIFGMVKMPKTELKDGKHRLKLPMGN